MSHRAPPRDRVTESLVREAALTLFAQRGYHGAGIRQGSQVVSEVILTRK
jgi:AcrR family transcriptional regulator